MKALDSMDPIFEHRARLAIAALLARNAEMNFSAFKQQLDMTDGNLGAQLKKLEDAGYVSVKKVFVDRKPVSWYTLSAEGRKALEAHINALRQLING